MSSQTLHVQQSHDAAARQAAKAAPVRSGVPQGASLEQLLIDPQQARPADLIALQHTIGNRSVQRLIQRQLRVGDANDRYEQEADRTAQAVLSDHTAAAVSPARSEPRLQRIWSAEELLNRGGKPKSNILFYKMSTKYKKILAALSSYDDYLSVPAEMRAGTGAGYVRGATEYLDNARTSSTQYLAAHDPAQKRAKVVSDLVNQIGPEETALAKVAANYDAVKSLSGRAAIEAAKTISAPKPVSPPPTAPPVSTPPQSLGPKTKPLPTPPPKPTVPTTPTAPPPLSPEDYLDKITNDGFKWLSRPGLMGATTPVASHLLATPGKGYGALSQAEIAAIRIYTAADYMYINPALVGSEGYLKGSLNPNKQEVKTGWNSTQLSEMQSRLQTDPKGLLEEMGKEGLQHSAMAIQGLKKLPKFSARLKRGERWTEQEYKDRYQKGKVDVRKSFTSVSTDPTVAVNFASQAVPPQRGVVLDLDIKDGREINELSVYYDPSGGEGEVLLLPGTEFTVKNVDDPAVKPAGTLNVEMEQTK